MRCFASTCILLLLLLTGLSAASVDTITITAPIAEAAEPVGSGTTPDQTYGLATGRFRVVRSPAAGMVLEGDVVVGIELSSASTAIFADFILHGGTSTGFPVAFTGTSASVTVPAEPGWLDLYLEPVGDAIAEGRETVTIALTASTGIPPTYNLGASASNTVTIADEDVHASILTIDGQADEWTSASAHPRDLARTGLMRFRIDDGGAALIRTVTVVTGGTATLDADYQLAYSASATPQVVTTVAYAAPSGTTSIGIAPGALASFYGDEIISFQNTAVAPTQSSIAYYLVTGLSSPSATYSEVTITPALGHAIPAEWTIMRLGRHAPLPAGQDYLRMSVDIGSLDDLYFWVLPINDAAAEGAETVTLTALVSPDYRQVSPTAGQVVITDDESIASITASSNAQEPATSGTATVSFTRPVSTTRDVEIPYTVSGTANAADYSTLSGIAVLRSGQTQTSIVIAPVDDDFQEGTENVTITLGSSPDYLVQTTTSGGWGPSATINIIDLQGTASVTASGAAAEPTATGSFIVSMAWAPGASRSTTVAFVFSGTATIGTDYTTSATTAVVFPAGTATQEVVITPEDDTVFEPDETAVLTLVPGAGYRLATGADSASLTIRDKQASSGTVAFSGAATAAIVEGGNAYLELERSGASATARASIAWKVAFGTANAADIDPGPVSGTVVMEAGETAKTITIPIKADGVSEGTETFTVEIESVAGASLGAISGKGVNILDRRNDLPGNGDVTITVQAYPAEPATAGSFLITLPANVPANQVVQLGYTLTGTATSADYQAPVPAGYLSIAAGTDRTTLVITPMDDAFEEGDETVILTITVGGSVYSQTMTIADDDPAIVGFDASSLTILEGGSATVNVTKAKGVKAAVSVNVLSRNGSAVAGADFVAVNSTLNWSVGETGAKSITLATVGDGFYDPGEMFFLDLVPGTGSATTGQVFTVTVNIRDPSNAPYTIADPTQGGGCGGSGLAALVLLAGGLGLWRRRR